MSQQRSHGVINQNLLGRKTDYLFRISMKGLVRNDKGEILVVKENGRTWWDLPGGGMDHDENIKSALAREMQEEVSLSGDFSYKVLAIDDPSFLVYASVWQVRIIFEVKPENYHFAPGVEADEVKFINPEELKDSPNPVEKSVFLYASITSPFI